MEMNDSIKKNEFFRVEKYLKKENIIISCKKKTCVLMKKIVMTQFKFPL